MPSLPLVRQKPQTAAVGIQGNRLAARVEFVALKAHAVEVGEGYGSICSGDLSGKIKSVVKFKDINRMVANLRSLPHRSMTKLSIWPSSYVGQHPSSTKARGDCRRT